MCGIAGTVAPGGACEADLRRMAAAIAHRGPDDEQVFMEGPVGLTIRRLSIIDLAGGRQPIGNEDGSAWIVQNGEIYNYRELRAELIEKGHRFRTESDTEVVLHLYEEEGEDFVDRLRGMFATAIWDARRRKLVLARDRLGQKPLFYARAGDRFLFGSELKAILAVWRRPVEIELEALHHYLTLRFLPSPLTMVRGIRKLAPAHVLVYRDGEIHERRYWQPSFVDKLPGGEAELLEGLEERLAEAVESHLVSDVEVGAHLSGGLDSSAVVALMMRARNGARPKTFAVGVPGSGFDEMPFARQVAEHCGTDHYELSAKPELSEVLPNVVWHLDEPSDPIALCMYFAAQLASRHVKVVLGGDGGDELFAGFDRYRGVGLAARYRWLPAPLRRALANGVYARLPDAGAYKNLTQRLRWLDHVAGAPDAASRYAAATGFFRFDEAGKDLLYGDTLARVAARTDSGEVLESAYRAAPARSDLDRMLYTDMVTRLPEHSLMLGDRMSMAHGLEQRSPLVDHRLVEYLGSFPSNLKIRGSTLKYALRRVASGWLPREIVDRPKHGFMLPVAQWLRGDLRPWLEPMILSSHFVREGLFRGEAVRTLIEEHCASRADHHVRLWMLLNLEVWHRLYVEGQSRDDLAGYLSETTAGAGALRA